MNDEPVSKTQALSGGTVDDSSTDSTFERAKRCPRCGQPGELSNTIKNYPRPGAEVATYVCVNELCITRGEGWIIQVNADGTIPERQEGPKQFEASPQAMSYGKAIVEQTKHQMDKGEVEVGSA